MAIKPKAQPTAPVTPRVSLLQDAIEIISADRNAAYGDPEDNFRNIATYWSAYLAQSGPQREEFTVTAQDVAHMMILMKMARLATNPTHYDSLLDIAGYAACAEDCRVQSL